MATSNPLALMNGSRAFIAGRTGSGKTTLSRYIMAVSPGRWIIIDRKIDPSLAIGSTVLRGLPPPPKLYAAMQDVTGVVVRPTVTQFRDGSVDAWIADIHESMTHVGLYVDELYSLHRNGQIGDGLASWLTRGRSKHQAFLGCAQRPAWISNFILSESDFFYVMTVNKLEDRKRIEDYIGDKSVLAKIGKRQFFRYDVDGDALAFFPRGVRITP